MVGNRITNKERFLTAQSACPICGGYDHKKRGIGERCSGFLCEDGEHVICTREQYAGALELVETQPRGYRHLLHGACKCGIQHGAVIHQIQDSQARKTANGQSKVVAEYIYHDAKGKASYKVLRHEDKHFSQMRSEKGTWVYGIKEIARLPYHLPDLIKASRDTPVYIPEGEKDVDNLRIRGFTATCNSGGARNWDDNLNQYFKGRRVVLLADNDQAGREHVEIVATKLQGIAVRITVLHFPELPEKGDISDWFAQGGTKEKLEALVQTTLPTWEAPKRKFKYASDVTVEPVNWLWKKRIARGMLTLAVGDPGLGKSMVMTIIAAIVSTGGILPDNTQIEPGGVIIMAPEDSESHTIVPRLIAAGADLSKIILLTKVTDYDQDGNEYERTISFPDDASILEEAIIDCGASLAIIDPVLAMINEKYDSHKDQAVRVALGRVLDVAEKRQCAVMGIVHLNKSQSGNALYRSSASIGFIGMARVGLFVVPDPDNERGGVIVNHKNNLADRTKTSSIRYSFHETPEEIGYIEWEGESIYSQQELLNQSTPTDNKKSEQELDILTVLKENGRAMTPVEIHEQLGSGQSLHAMEQMLKRKLEQGILMKPARGMYTYNGNPLYTPSRIDVSNVSLQSEVSNVSFVSLPESTASEIETHIVSFTPSNDVSLQKTSGQTHKTHIDSDVSLPQKTCHIHSDQPVVQCGMCLKCYNLYVSLKQEAEMLARNLGYPALQCGRQNIEGTQQAWQEVVNKARSDMQLQDVIGALKTYQGRNKASW